MMTWKGLDVRTLQVMGELCSPYTAEHLMIEVRSAGLMSLD